MKKYLTPLQSAIHVCDLSILVSHFAKKNQNKVIVNDSNMQLNMLKNQC